MSDFPRRLQQLRERKGISRRALAELCGMEYATIRRYERGDREPSLSALTALADFFGVSLDELTGH